MKPNALLFVVDWFHSGRMDLGEKFAFTSLLSELKVTSGTRTLLLDRFSFQPQENIAASPANFSQYQSLFSAYLVGTPTDDRFVALATKLLQLRMPESTGLHFDMTEKEVVLTVSEAKEGVVVVRAMAKSRINLLPLCEALMQELATDTFLGYNPVRRKY